MKSRGVPMPGNSFFKIQPKYGTRQQFNRFLGAGVSRRSCWTVATPLLQLDDVVRPYKPYKLVTLVPAHAASLEVSIQKKAYDHSQLHSPTEKYGRLELICNFSTGRKPVGAVLENSLQLSSQYQCTLVEHKNSLALIPCHVEMLLYVYCSDVHWGGMPATCQM